MINKLNLNLNLNIEKNVTFGIIALTLFAASDGFCMERSRAAARPPSSSPTNRETPLSSARPNSAGSPVHTQPAPARFQGARDYLSGIISPPSHAEQAFLDGLVPQSPSLPLQASERIGSVLPRGITPVDRSSALFHSPMGTPPADSPAAPHPVAAEYPQPTHGHPVARQVSSAVRTPTAAGPSLQRQQSYGSFLPTVPVAAAPGAQPPANIPHPVALHVNWADLNPASHNSRLGDPFGHPTRHHN